MLRNSLPPLFGLVLACAVSADEPAGQEPIDFARDVQPILAARCVTCHGDELQEGQLRLDGRAAALQGGVSGQLVQPGHPEQSLLYRRLQGLDDLDRMPLDEEPLGAQELAVIRRWIAEGATWPAGVGSDAEAAAPHWAYQPPHRHPLPHVQRTDWPRNALDYFVLAEMEKRGLTPAEPADPAVLLRRVYLDLIGVPPSVEEVDAFLSDDDPLAYERVVDRLLASPQYGPHWARPWLDAARYADSNGYQADQYRSVWPFSDWIVQALNQDMPFDQFTIWQLAGDLLPEATVEQKIASGFHRLTTCNVEAGVDPEENRVEQLLDRVNTTATVWLGTTLECAQCHNHKYDPFTQRDYYRLFAFFNNTPLEVEGDGVTYDFVGPKMQLPLPDDQHTRLAEVRAQLAEITRQLEARTQELTDTQARWADEARLLLEESAGAPPARPKLPPAILAILKKESAQRSKKEQNQLREHFLSSDDQVVALRKQKTHLESQAAALAPETTLVMVELPEPRETRMFMRGNFLTPGQAVEPGTPRVLHALPGDAPANRLGLAHGTRHRQSLVGPDFWSRPGFDARRFRPPGRAADASTGARLAGAGVSRSRLVQQAYPPVDRKLIDVPAVVASESGNAGTRSGESLAGPLPPDSPVGGSTAGQRPGGQRRTVRQSGRAANLSASARRHLAARGT
jgi:hypothetical protein